MGESLQSLFGLDGKVALVTGAGRGIGAAVCALFTDAGATVYASDRDAISIEAVACDLELAIALPCDVSREQDVTAAIAKIVRDAGRLDVLVHAAGIFPKYDFVSLTAAQWDEIQGVNLRGTFLVMREAIRVMRQHGQGGAIVNISSIGGERASTTNNSAYCASKAGVTSLTRTMALECAGDGIRINAILPGGVATPGAQEAVEDMQRRGLSIGGPATGPGRMPMGRVGTVEEMASACLFLASPAASYITGQTLAVDGGFLVS